MRPVKLQESHNYTFTMSSGKFFTHNLYGFNTVRGNKPLQRNQHFAKATSDGNGNFSNVTIVANVQ